MGKLCWFDHACHLYAWKVVFALPFSSFSGFFGHRRLCDTTRGFRCPLWAATVSLSPGLQLVSKMDFFGFFPLLLWINHATLLSYLGGEMYIWNERRRSNSWWRLNWGEDAVMYVKCVYSSPLHKERLTAGNGKMTINVKLMGWWGCD